MRLRAMSAGAAFSGSVAAVCLWSALASGRPGPLLGLLAGAAAAIALGRESHLRPTQVSLRLCPRDGVLLDEGGDGETPLRPIGVTPHLICLAKGGPNPTRLSIWRDGLASDGFRRIAAYALWRRSVIRSSTDELIAGKIVTEQLLPSARRGGRP